MGIRFYNLGLALLVLAAVLVRGDEPARTVIPIVRPNRSDKVDFDREIIPMLRGNCLPCHNKTTTKADLVLETPAEMLKGGESGPAIAPGKALESLMMQVSTHEAKPRMPPKENKVNAVSLTPEQLGLLALWIDQGALASPKREETIAWQALPENLNPIFSVALTENGRYAACGRGNRVDVYRTQDGQFLGRLSDPALTASNGAPALTHRDEVHSIAFSADGEWLASGGYREAKLWRRRFPVRSDAEPPSNLVPKTNSSLALNEHRDLAVEVIHGVVVLSDAETKRFALGLTRDLDAEAVAATARRNVVAKRADRDRRQAILEGARKELESQRERVKKAQEIYTAAAKEVDLRETRIGAVRKKEDEAGIAVLKSQWTTLRPKLTEDQKKSATAKLEEARKETAKAVEEAKLPKQKLEAARIELELGNQTVDRLQGELLAQHWRRQTAETELVAAEAGASQAEKTAETGCRDALAAGFAPGGQYIVSSHADGRLHVWRATDGSPVDTIPLKAAITQILPGDSGQVWLKSGTHGWLSVSLQPEWTLAHMLGSEKSDSPFADQVTALAFRADGTRLAAGSGEPTRTGDITVWEPVSGRLLYSVPALHSDTVLALAFSPDGWSLASGGADRFARIVDTTSAKATRALEGHTGHVLGVAWSPDGQRLATAGADSVVKLWDPQTGEKAKQAGGFSKEVTGVSYLAGRDRLVAASGENELRVLNENGEKVDSFKGLNDFTYSVGTTPDGKWIVAGGQDGVLRIWQSGKPEPVLQLTNQPVAALKTVFHAE